MTATTNESDRPDPTRTGAVWVTGTGAFLLLTAAAVFTAVRWEQIPKEARFAGMVLATGALLLAGRRLERTLPATAGALFHLGAFLVPLDVAAFGIHAKWDSSTLLLVEGVAATITFGWAAATERSVVLRWAFGGAVVVLAAGIGATTPLPPTLVLAGFGAAALALGRPDTALPWATVATLTPVALLVGRDALDPTSPVGRLGLCPTTHPLGSAVAAVAAAAMIGLLAQRRDEPELALVAAVMGAAGVAASWASASPQAGQVVVALGAAFLGLELAAFATRRYPFWATPSRVLAGAAERVALVGLLPLLGTAVAAVAVHHTAPELALTSLLVTGAWVIADRRRGGAGIPLATTIASSCAFASVAFVTSEHLPLAFAAAALAALAVLADRSDGPLVAAVAASAAPVLAWSSPVTAAALGVVGAIIVGEAAVRRSRVAPSSDPSSARVIEESAWLLSLTSLLPLAMGVWVVVDVTGHVVGPLMFAAVAAGGLAAWVDRGDTSGDLPLGTLVRAGSVAVLAGTAGLSALEVTAVAAAVAVASIADAVRLRTPAIALGASLAVPVVVGALVRSTGLSVPSTGVALTLSAVVLAGLGSLLGSRWALPVGAAAAIAVAGGLVLAGGDPTAFANALMITGGVAVAASIGLDRPDAALASGVAVTVGLWMRLDQASVTVVEPYVAPVGLLLMLAGAQAHRRSAASSWLAYGPAIALVGGAALLERLDGQSGWHGIVAGAIGVAAVEAGGHRRLAGPLVLGTALLVILTGYETVSITAGLPTWTWLALGGATLLGAGVAMERHDVGPIETGRRLVDVVAERFT